MLNLTLLNVLKTITVIDNILYTGFNYYIIITEIPVSPPEKPLYVKLSFPEKTRLRFS